MRSYMVVCGISKMLHCAIERFLISILMKINFFVLQRIEIALHRGVIIRASSLAHALRQIVFLAKVGERLRCVRAALIAMKNQTVASLSLTAECFPSVRIAKSLVIRRSVKLATTLRSYRSIIVQLYRTSPPLRNKKVKSVAHF